MPACRWRRGLFPYLPPSCCPASGTVCSPSRKENSADRKPEVEMDSLKKRPPPLKAGGLSPAPFRIQPQGAITTRASQKGPRVIRGIDSRVSAWPLNLICLFCLLSVVSVLISPALVPGSPAWLSAVSASSTRAGLSEAPSSYKIPTNTSNANDGESREKDGKRADDFGYHAGASQPDGSRRKEERAATLRAGPDEFAEHLYLQGLKREGWYSATFEFELRAQIRECQGAALNLFLISSWYVQNTPRRRRTGCSGSFFFLVHLGTTCEGNALPSIHFPPPLGRRLQLLDVCLLWVSSSRLSSFQYIGVTVCSVLPQRHTVLVCTGPGIRPYKAVSNVSERVPPPTRLPPLLLGTAPGHVYLFF